MPVDEADLGLDWEWDATTVSLVALGVFVAGWFFSLKQLFGSYSIFEVIDEYKRKKALDDQYNRLFQTRENLCFHVGWARSRGESSAEIKRMVEELKAVDRAIDEIEAPRRRLLGAAAARKEQAC